jgi:hypothetical protein
MNLDETYTAEVTATDDPEQRGRIRCSCVGLLADEDADLPMWIEPELDWGWFVVPDVGEIVEIVAQKHGDGDDSFGQSSLESLALRWRGARHWTSGDPAVPREVPEDFKTNYGKRRGFATPQGHLLMFDDTEGKEKLTLTWSGVREGSAKFSFYSIDEDGSLVMSNRNGSLMYFNAKDRQVTMVDEWGNSITTDELGIHIIDYNGNIIDMSLTSVQVISQSGLILEASNGVKVGGIATSPMVLGTELIAAIDAMLAGGVPTPMDGGAGLKATMITAWNAIKATALSAKGFVQ